MKARILAATTMFTLGCGFAANAADNQLLGLVMPDAKVLAGINVDQAKATPFGQYILSQIAPQERQFQEMAAVLGFDPRRDVRELLVASDPTVAHTGLGLARGNFDPQRVTSAAAQRGATTEVYGGVTILKPPSGNGKPIGLAFLDSTLAVFGDLANVRGAIDRRSTPTALSPAMSAKVSEWSALQDAWMVATIPPALLKKNPDAPQIPGLSQQAVIQAVQQTAAGIKFGSTVVVKAQAQTDTAQNATTLAGVVQLLTNLALMQTKADPQVTALAKALVVTTAGETVNMTLSLPADQFEQMLRPKARPAAATAPRQQRAM